MSTKTKALEVNSLSKTFDGTITRTLFTDLSFSVEKGQSLAIVGPSGVGKSTLMHILARFEKPTTGHLLLNGQSYQSYSLSTFLQDHIGFVFQQLHLLDDETVMDNILLPARIKGLDISKESTARNRAQDLCKELELTDLSKNFVKHLSGGEKQRVCIARALVNNPTCILADEPTGHLDAQTAKHAEDLLINVCKNKMTSLIVVTHDVSFAKKLDNVLTLKK